MSRAAVCHTFSEPLTVEEMTLDRPGRDEVRVRVTACAICHSDVAYAAGAWGGELPAVFGHEASGIVALHWDLADEFVRDYAAARFGGQGGPDAISPLKELLKRLNS